MNDHHEPVLWHRRAQGTMAVEALQANGFDAQYFCTGREAADYMLGFVSPGMTVGFGGSETLAELGIAEKVKQKGAQPAFEITSDAYEDFEALGKNLKKTLLTDVYFTGSNAVTLDGALVNVDGGGNRVAAMTFGPDKVIVAAGVNKICRDEAAAWERIKMVAAPTNAHRLNMQTPCAQAGICMDCKAPNRICRIYSVLRHKPLFTDITVVIIGESMGF